MIYEDVDNLVDIGKKCPECGKPIMGFKLFPNADYIEITCECQTEKAKKQAEEDKKRKWQDRIQKNIQNSGIPPKQRRMHFDNFKERPGTEVGLKAAQKYCSKFFDIHKGLLLSGPCGCGKTHLACAIGNKLLNKGVQVKFVRLADMFDRIRGTYDRTGETEADVLEEYKEARLLIIDDVGTTVSSDWNKSIFHSIIDYRMNYELPTIMTTNLTLEELSRELDSRTVDRLKEGFHSFVLNASSYRQEA